LGEQKIGEEKRQQKDSFSPHPLPLLAHPLPTSPQFFAHPRCPPAFSLACSISAWKRKGKESFAVKHV